MKGFFVNETVNFSTSEENAESDYVIHTSRMLFGSVDRQCLVIFGQFLSENGSASFLFEL